MFLFNHPVTWKQIKDFINDYVRDNDIINYIDIEPSKCLHLAIDHEGPGVSIVNGNASCPPKPYEYSLIMKRIFKDVPDLTYASNTIEIPINEINFYLKIAEVNSEKGKAEDNKLTGRDVKKLWEMDFKSRQRILISKYLQ